MSNTSLSAKLRQRIDRNKYLEELRSLMGRPVETQELGTLDDVEKLRKIAKKFEFQETSSWDVEFEEIRSDRFVDFVRRLSDTNPSSVYIWTPRTIYCGALLVPSMTMLKLDFDFGINKEGILAFLTSDAQDRLLLDFYSDNNGRRRLKIEVQGDHWRSIHYS